MRITRRKFLKRSAAVAVTGAAGLTAYGFAEAASLRVTRHTVTVPRLPAAFAGKTVALVTDLHLGPYNGIDFIREAVRLTNEAEPDQPEEDGEDSPQDGGRQRQRQERACGPAERADDAHAERRREVTDSAATEDQARHDRGREHHQERGRLRLVLRQPDAEDEERDEQHATADAEQAGEHARREADGDEQQQQPDRAHAWTAMTIATSTRKPPKASLSVRSRARARTRAPTWAPRIAPRANGSA